MLSLKFQFERMTRYALIIVDRAITRSLTSAKIMLILFDPGI